MRKVPLLHTAANMFLAVGEKEMRDTLDRQEKVTSVAFFKSLTHTVPSKHPEASLRPSIEKETH